MKRLLALLGLVLTAPAAQAESSDLETVYSWMSGSFSSAAQAAKDPAFYHITLEMAPIWTGREGEYWIYVEQAAATAKDQPYRQRVYRVSEGQGGIIESAVYLLPDPAAAVGAWQAENPLAGLSPDDLELRDGCTVYLARTGEDRFEGSTRAKECTSTLRGAAYATSGVIVTPAGIESWDRGFDADDQQVWGAEKGAYIFIRE